MKAPTNLAVFSIAIFFVGITGCGSDQFPPYSESIKFSVRQDPIIKSAKDLGDERFDPERPGLLPILKFDDALQPDNPYQDKLRQALASNLKTIIEKDHSNFAQLPAEKKLELENKVLKHASQHHKEFAVALDKILRDPALLSDKDRQELDTTLTKMFGTPAKPTINAEATGIDKAALAELKLDDATLAKGSTRYRIHCMHCHGVPGDGRGPTARWVNPHPRDFRAGLFKFQSTNRDVTNMPMRSDLLRTLRQGLEGTAMPSFSLLSDADLDAMVSYVMFLSLRGLTEIKAISDMDLDTKAQVLKASDPIPESLKFWASKIFTEGWLAANQPNAEIKVAEYPYSEKEFADSVKRGQMIFTANPTAEFKKEFFAHAQEKDPKLEKDAIEAKYNEVIGVKCVSCHIDYGRQAKFKFDEWGTLVRANNFTLGIFRGGRRPVDIYYRVHSGIPGSEMTPFSKSFKDQDRYLWDVVNFVSVMSYPAMQKGINIRLDP